jgi:hypothetical protein
MEIATNKKNGHGFSHVMASSCAFHAESAVWLNIGSVGWYGGEKTSASKSIRAMLVHLD